MLNRVNHSRNHAKLAVVMDGETVVGVVTKIDLIESDYATVTPSTKVELLKGVLNDAKIAIVLERENVVGVVTKIDLIDYLAEKATPIAAP